MTLQKCVNGEMVDMSAEEEAALLAMRPTLDDMKAVQLAVINKEYDTRTNVLAAGYPERERESWPVQTKEAEALQADASAATPWIDAAAAARGDVTREQLAANILAMDAAYRTVHGGLTGTRQRLRDEIAAATTIDQVNAVQWPQEGA